MIVLREAAIGRSIVYRREEGEPQTGVITSISLRRAFVQFGGQPYSVAVSPAELDFIEPSKRSSKPNRAVHS
ncbi:hypothetical protein ACVWVY_006012 [Bradyrhizobium sp. URHC0002]